MQIDLFSYTLEQFKFSRDKPIKLFEAFSGVGMQRMALNRLGINYESVGYSEIDKYAIISYATIHCGLRDEILTLTNNFKKKHIENTRKKPRDLSRKLKSYLREEVYKIANDMDCNFGDICKIKGADLPQIDLFTYSFPCTDLSKAGQQKGLNNTRSGLVYEVLRILQELKDKNSLPTVLLMENVVDLVQVKFIKQFNLIQAELEELGYSNYVQCLNAKDYGVAQNRDRVFMVSVLGDYYYQFPQPFPLEKRLRDYLQPLEEVEEKYFIKDYEKLLKINDSYSQLQGGKWGKLHDIGKRVYSKDYISPTIHTMQGGNLEPKVVIQQLARGYNEGNELEFCPSITANSWHENNFVKYGGGNYP